MELPPELYEQEPVLYPELDPVLYPELEPVLYPELDPELYPELEPELYDEIHVPSAFTLLQYRSLVLFPFASYV